MLTEWGERRLDVATRYAAAAAASGQLAAEEAEFRDTIFAIMEGALWRQLVGERSWSDEALRHLAGVLWNASISD